MAVVTGEVPEIGSRPMKRGSDGFEDLVRAHQARVARLAQRLLGWPADVDDVVQEVFVAAWKGFSSFRGQSTIETWLVRITINACRRANRRRMFRLGFLRKLAEQPWAQAAARDDVEHAERGERVRAAVRSLPVKYREVIVLKYLEGLETEAVMKALSLSRSAVDVRLHRARELLSRSLAQWVTP